MTALAPGRPPKYYFLIYRISDQELYSAATIAKLLNANDLHVYPQLSGTLDQVRFRARQSLARVARQYRLNPCGVVFWAPTKRETPIPPSKDASGKPCSNCLVTYTI